MVGSDGLAKNETISMVRDRYYIKTGGDNAPMNIGPAFKLGMNVKEMSHFSTTIDAVIFPHVIAKVIGEETTPQGKGVKLKDTLEEAGMILNKDETLKIIDTNSREYNVDINQLENSYLIPVENGADILIENSIIKDVLKISKIKG